MYHENTDIKNIKGEVWMPIVGYEGRYDISSFGRVKCVYSKDARGNPRKKLIKKSFVDKNGYVTVCLTSKIKKQRTELVHRLVAFAFVKNNDNKPYVNHVDGVKTNNIPENLEWVTMLENSHHAIDNGLTNWAVGEDCRSSKLSNEEVVRIFKSKSAIVDLAKEYNVHSTTIGHIKSGKNWSWITGKAFKPFNIQPNAKFLTVNGVSKSYSGWARLLGVKPNVISYRIKAGWSVQDAATKETIKKLK